jgi:integrase
MARARNKLTAKQAVTLTAPGRHSDGGSLYLVIDGQGEAMRRRWLFLFQWNGKRREMGLGSAAVVSRSENKLVTPLAKAREARDDAERMVREGKDPIAARDLARDEQAAKPTFGSVTDELIAAKESQWRNEKHRWQWRHTLEVYAATLRTRPVDEVDTAAVLEVLKPLWSEKPETASRLRGRIEAVLDAAKAQGYRSGENPAAWRGHLSHLLPARQRLTRGHHAAMPYADVPKFVAKLREREGGAALALELCILTAARSGEILGAKWTEFDLKEKVWTVPAVRMKAGKEHRVPLPGRAVAILEHLAEARQGDLVFAGQKDKSPLSNMAMVMVLRRMEIKGVTIHGFRSAFRDWVGNETAFPREVAEAALAHLIGNDVERAYRRSDALEKRRALMDAWAAYCEPKANESVGKAA